MIGSFLALAGLVLGGWLVSDRGPLRRLGAWAYDRGFLRGLRVRRGLPDWLPMWRPGPLRCGYPRLLGCRRPAGHADAPGGDR